LKGSEVEEYLKMCGYAEELNRDNNNYLISYRLDTGAEIAFDPRVQGIEGREASLFVESLPKRLINSGLVQLAERYPPKNPSSALRRVSHNLAELPELYRVRVINKDGLIKLVEWVRWA
jgi:hypothetical protein